MQTSIILSIIKIITDIIYFFSGRKIQINKINFENVANPLSGIGWTQKNDSQGLIADGFYSTLIFKTIGNKNNC